MKTGTGRWCATMSLNFACATTNITVRKVSGADEPGIRYSLPKPFLLITPNPNGDGSFKAEVIYLADESATYAIDASTKRGKFSLDVAVKEGLLSKVAWTQTDANVAAESVRVSGEIVKGELERRQKEEDAREEKSKAGQKAAEDELKKLGDLDARRLDVGIWPRRRSIPPAQRPKSRVRRLPERRSRPPSSSLPRQSFDAMRPKGRSRRRETRLKRSAESSTNRPFQALPPSRPSARSSGAPSSMQSSTTGRQSLLAGIPWDAGTLKQIPFETAAAPKEPKPPPEEPAPVGGTAMSSAWPRQASTHAITVEFNGLLDSIDTAQRRLSSRQLDGSFAPVAGTPFNAVLDDGNKRLVQVTFTQPLQAGTYRIFFPFKHNKDADGSVTITLDLTR